MPNAGIYILAYWRLIVRAQAFSDKTCLSFRIGKEYLVQAICLVFVAVFSFAAPIAINRVLTFVLFPSLKVLCSISFQLPRRWTHRVWQRQALVLDLMALPWSASPVHRSSYVWPLQYRDACTHRSCGNSAGIWTQFAYAAQSRNFQRVSDDIDATQSQFYIETASFNVGDETTDREDTSTVHDEDTLAQTPHETIQERHNGEAQNLLGQITNFVTSDMINITQGTDFLNLSAL